MLTELTLIIILLLLALSFYFHYHFDKKQLSMFNFHLKETKKLQDQIQELKKTFKKHD